MLMSKVTPNVNLYRSELKFFYPIDGSSCNYNDTSGTHGVSKHYITEFTTTDINIAMIGAHLLSMPTDPQRCSEREGKH